MSKSLRFRLRAAIFSWPMLASIIVGVFLLLWNQIYYWILYCISYEPIPLSAMCTTFLDSIFRANDLGGFGIFATILAVLPASTLFCEDYNSGYCKAILRRVERKRYLRETLLCSGISGGLAVFLPVLLSDIVWIINGEPNTGEQMGINYFTVFDGTVYGELQFVWNGFFLVLFLLLLAFLFGASWSVIGLCVSALIPNRYITLAAPFALFFGAHLILYRLDKPLLFSPANVLMPATDFIPFPAFPLLYQLGMLALASALCWKLLERRLRDV